MKGCSPESSGLGLVGRVAKNLFSSTTHGGWQKVWEVININISTFQTHALFRPNPAPRRMFGKSSKIHAFLLDAGEKKQQQLCVRKGKEKLERLHVSSLCWPSGGEEEKQRKGGEVFFTWNNQRRKQKMENCFPGKGVLYGERKNLKFELVEGGGGWGWRRVRGEFLNKRSSIVEP